MAQRDVTNFNQGFTPSAPAGSMGRPEHYATQAAQRRGLPPKRDMPVHDGPGPAIPRLDGAVDRDAPPMTMAAHAGGHPVGGGIIDTGPAQHQYDIRPIDILPQGAMQDPAFRQGQGAMLATSQPELAIKYGVIRGGRIVPPQQLLLKPAGQDQRLSQASLDGLNALQAAQESAVRAAAPKADDPPEPKEPLKPQTSEVRKAIEEADDFQLNAWREAMETSELNTPEQRRIIEARLEPLDVGEMVMKGHIEQRVPILPGKFQITLRSYDGATDLALKRLIMEEGRSVNVDSQYFLDKYVFYGLTSCLYAVNDKIYPDIHDDQGNFNDEKFLIKFNRVMRLPIYMLASIGTNVTWFDMRVRQLFRAEALGNG